jgi:hypothetical protein
MSMEYIFGAGPEKGTVISLSGESVECKAFFMEAEEKFKNDVPWGDFDTWAFGQKSPIYKNQRSHLDVMKVPTYLVLKDLSMRLGINQGHIKV